MVMLLDRIMSFLQVSDRKTFASGCLRSHGSAHAAEFIALANW